EETDDKELQERFEMLVSFLKSPESRKLLDESERFLADGRQVTLKIHSEDDNASYELKIE
ncbi:hypothetical protein ACFLYE_02315, partial [Chloroflexota bacterium]